MELHIYRPATAMLTAIHDQRSRSPSFKLVNILDSSLKAMLFQGEITVIIPLVQIHPFKI